MHKQRPLPLRAALAAVLFLVSAAASPLRADDPARARVDAVLRHVEADSLWLVSRLQMYWATHATDVHINGEAFARPAGGRAPSPTVKFDGTRNTASSYSRPRLEDIVPFDDDEEGSVTYINRQSGVMEKAHPSKTGRNISNVNREILGLARDAARLYARTGDAAYRRLALPVLDTYLRGIYFRNVPHDLNRGHQQTLVGMASFEVIHEDIVNEVTELYRLLKRDAPLPGEDTYDAALKKWADCIVAGGVPHNNWNIIQARFVARIAAVLRPDSCYADRRGRGHYTDVVVNRSSIRQWGLKRLADYGFDPETAVWCESAGYSCNVVADFAAIANELDTLAGIDLFAEIPVLRRSVGALPQYLFPNRMIAGFGDTHPGYLNCAAMDCLAAYAERHGLRALADSTRALRAAAQPDAPAADIERHVSQSFHAPNVSWLALRTGMHARHDLMASLNGSLGNHQHANGISLELYGKGYVLAPDAGIGRNLYGGLDYAEYYSQFPAHNTVCVDGVSSYPVMMSQHPFRLLSRYPATNGTGRFDSVAYAAVEFREPETDARQVRVVGVVKTSETGGYYIDIFRSRRNDGRDKTHDYFYHNLGQQMALAAADGTDLGLRPTDELAFAGGHLYAYSYIHDKHAARTDRDIRATFATTCPDGRRIDMNLWMQGYADRDVFRALSPVNLEYERMPNQPYRIVEQPVLTFVARQHGEAWTRPFVAVLEPSDTDEPGEIQSVGYFKPRSGDPSAVGICVTLRNGRRDYIFSSVQGASMRHEGMKARGHFSVVSR